MTLLQKFYRLAARERSPDADRQLGTLLAFIAGAVNAGGFIAISRYTSHMTGIVSGVADAIVGHQNGLAWMLVVFLICFITGAVTSSIIINFARLRHYRSEYAAALLLEAGLLLLFSFAAVGLFSGGDDMSDEIIELLSFIMGLQNAIITKMSQRAIRTTHVTGISTDIGVELGRYIARLFNKTVAYEPYRLRLNAQLLVAFMTGGLIGAESFRAYGFATIMPFSIILILVALGPFCQKQADQKA